MDDITQDLIKHFGKEYIENYYRFLYEKAEVFLSENDLQNTIIFNKQIFDLMFTDIMVDLKRLASYHNIKTLNETKLYTYAASWWLRRKPFQLENSDALKEYIYINESFVRSLLFIQIMDRKILLTEQNTTNLIKLTEHLHHHLKYRNVNPQTLELFVTALVQMPIA